MTFSHRVPCFRLDFRAPVVVMVLAAIAIPIELRWPAYDSSGIKLSLPFFADVIENILGFIPVGIVLTALGPARAIAIAASMSALSELGQLMMAHRDPSVIDVISNVTGAGLGVAIASRWNITPPPLPVSARISLLAAFLAGIVIVTEWMTLPPLPNARGATLLGRLEADWELGEGNGRLVQDRSGYGLNGRFSREPKRTHSENVLAAQFDGARDSVNFGQAAALRLVGSTTITAWIKSTSFPRDDAAIVSSFSGGGAGFQLDTTIDAGPRTIGFKIWNECGALAARYGALDGIVAVARAAEGGSEMQVTVSRVGAAAPPSTLVERLKANPGESAAALLGRAVDAVANQVEDRWKQDNAVRSGREQTLEAVVPLGGLKDWVEVRARLARVGAVRRSELRALSRHEARVSLLYVGEPSQLATALAQAELRLEGQPPNHVLRLAGASQGSE